jgi:hypothetical protein
MLLHSMVRGAEECCEADESALKWQSSTGVRMVVNGTSMALVNGTKIAVVNSAKIAVVNSARMAVVNSAKTAVNGASAEKSHEAE